MKPLYFSQLYGARFRRWLTAGRVADWPEIYARWLGRKLFRLPLHILFRLAGIPPFGHHPSAVRLTHGARTRAGMMMTCEMFNDLLARVDALEDAPRFVRGGVTNEPTMAILEAKRQVDVGFIPVMPMSRECFRHADQDCARRCLLCGHPCDQHVEVENPKDGGVDHQLCLVVGCECERWEE